MPGKGPWSRSWQRRGSIGSSRRRTATAASVSLIRANAETFTEPHGVDVAPVVECSLLASARSRAQDDETLAGARQLSPPTVVLRTARAHDVPAPTTNAPWALVASIRVRAPYGWDLVEAQVFPASVVREIAAPPRAQVPLVAAQAVFASTTDNRPAARVGLGASVVVGAGVVADGLGVSAAAVLLLVSAAPWWLKTRPTSTTSSTRRSPRAALPSQFTRFIARSPSSPPLVPGPVPRHVVAQNAMPESFDSLLFAIAATRRTPRGDRLHGQRSSTPSPTRRPMLATYSFLPVIEAFASTAGVDVETRDISLAGPHHRRLRRPAPRGPADRRRPRRARRSWPPRPRPTSSSCPTSRPPCRSSRPPSPSCRPQGYDLPDYPDEPHDRRREGRPGPLRQGQGQRRQPRPARGQLRPPRPRRREELRPQAPALDGRLEPRLARPTSPRWARTTSAPTSSRSSSPPPTP